MTKIKKRLSMTIILNLWHLWKIRFMEKELMN